MTARIEQALKAVAEHLEQGDWGNAQRVLTEFAGDVRTETLAEAIQCLCELLVFAPDGERAPGINFTIGALMALADEAGRFGPKTVPVPTPAPVESAGDETGEAPVGGRESARSGLVSDLVESCGLNEVYEDDVLAFLVKYDAKHRADVLAGVVS